MRDNSDRDEERCKTEQDRRRRREVLFKGAMGFVKMESVLILDLDLM